METQRSYPCRAHHTSYLLLRCLPLTDTVSRYTVGSKCLVCFKTAAECLKVWSPAFSVLAHVTSQGGARRRSPSTPLKSTESFPRPLMSNRIFNPTGEGEVGAFWGWLQTDDEFALLLDGHRKRPRKRATRSRVFGGGFCFFMCARPSF